MISVGIDVAKGKSKICIMRSGGEVIMTPKDFRHTKNELQRLVEQIHSYDEDVKVVLESTGQYHIPVVKYLSDNGIFISVVNALRMKKFTSQDIRKVKNDRIDSIHIAMYGLTYWSELEEFKPANEVYAELRTLSRQYDNTIALLVGARSNFANLINNVMPGLDKMLADGNKSNRTIAFVEHYVHFENITKKSEKQFINDVMKWKTKKGYHISEAKAKEIYALAQNGIPVLPNTKSTTIIVREAAKLIYELKSTRDTILAQMQAFAKTLPEYSIIRDMHCVGEVLSARIIAEIGDITRYKNKHSLIAYAGIDAPPYQSGKFNSTERHISKRGNAYLRKIGFEIMQSLIMHKPVGDPVFDYITKKRLEGKSAKSAMIAGLNKFLRIYYGKVNELYSSLYSLC
ncbi:MAG: IS110 family transposase [Eubacterium sp.]